MYNVREVTKDLYWVGGNDRRLALFENIHPIPEGISYNSYLLLDEKTVLLDTVDWSICNEFIENIKYVLGDRPLDYMIINHMEPDHAGCIGEVVLRYPDVKIIGNKKTFDFMKQFGFEVGENAIEIKDGDYMSFGEHEFLFISAPMVHWPETMATFDTTNGVLFSADAFGTFGSLDGKLFNDEMDFDREFLVPARRYYTNIVGKYGPQVQALLKKAKDLDIKYICPLHGPVWRTNLDYFIDKYNKWSSYEPEEKGVMIVYGSMYGNTEAAAENLARRLVEKGMTNVVMYDASKTHVSYLISDAFKYSHIVLASATYNLNIYTPVQNFLLDMKALNLQKRTVGIIENGTWAPRAGKLIRELLGEMKEMNVLEKEVLIKSSMKKENIDEMDALANTIIESMK
ncbi:Beta-lactamase domain protein [[Clostridium] ultunense Esp]|uniref:Beta-lactamase domain protein n=1 Tax=[Clostridium] ultunense Esp TaxID=1288971 RepID=M1ZKY1_9FIRM|nr:FprA family A-type flavoprotein [Schnuerera ultunensis]CCQ96242.1 Beta-lactamase domain protein [[Clostridium] ultunense Esp]SHD78141.1 Beta-lactamase domain protein [[Clostridium] ultunense Esp]